VWVRGPFAGVLWDTALGIGWSEGGGGGKEEHVGGGRPAQVSSRFT
jgi:hypothetical protein